MIKIEGEGEIAKGLLWRGGEVEVDDRGKKGLWWRWMMPLMVGKGSLWWR